MKRSGWCSTGFALALSAPIAAQTPPATTLQQDFVAATKLDSDGYAAGALAAWQAIEHRPGVAARTHALVQLRKSRTLFLLGRPAAAAEAARAGLAGLPP